LSGVANVVDINYQRKDADWGFYLADLSTRGHGIGLYVEYCVLAYVFDYLKLETLLGEVLETNPEVCALHESLGFVRTGRLKDRVIKNGVPVDAITIAMTRSSWTSTHRVRLEERLRAKGHDPQPLLSILESHGTDDEVAADRYEKIDNEITANDL
jgi:hypothetical protein